MSPQQGAPYSGFIPGSSCTFFGGSSDLNGLFWKKMVLGAGEGKRSQGSGRVAPCPPQPSPAQSLLGAGAQKGRRAGPLGGGCCQHLIILTPSCLLSQRIEIYNKKI